MNRQKVSVKDKGTRRTYSKHGLTRLKRAVKDLGGRVIDKRTSLGKALAAWRAELVADLGGEVSVQEQAIVDLAAKTKLLLDSIDAWLLIQPSLINAKKRSLLPVVRERTQLADALARYLGQLGLKRRSKPVPDLAKYLAEHYSQDAPDDGNQESQEPSGAERSP